MMPRVLILEGGDGTGKSTLGAALASAWKGTVLHAGRPDADALEMYVARPARWLGSVPGLVLDRSFIGSRVWSAMGYHAPTLTGEQWRAVCRWYADQGARVWVMVKAPGAMREVVLGRGEGHDDADDAVAGQHMFIEMVREMAILYVPVAIMSTGVTMQIQKEI